LIPLIQSGVDALECYIFIQISKQLNNQNGIALNDIGQFKVVKIRIS